MNLLQELTVPNGVSTFAKMTLLRILLGVSLLGVASLKPAQARTVQSHAIPHCVRILLRPEAARSLRAPFEAVRQSHADIQSIVLDSSQPFAQSLQLPAQLRALKLRPFMPELSVVFENIREHINPSLFRESDAPAQPTAAYDMPLLRSTEDRLSRWFTLWFDAEITPEQAASLCKKSLRVEDAEPVYARAICAGEYHPNDPLIDSLYALKLMHAFEAWHIVRCDSDIRHDDTMIVADVDLGVYYTHPDLAPAVWYNPGEVGTDENGDSKSNNKIDDDSDGYVDDYQGWNFVNFLYQQDNSPFSYSSNCHGSHTSGIMAAAGNNGIGIPGVAFGAKLMMIKTAYGISLDGVNPPPVVAGAEGIIFAADHKANVINCSWGGPERSIVDQDAVSYAFARNSIVVVAAGNNGTYEEFYPASCEHAFSVTNIDASRSVVGPNPDYNTHVAVAAPGFDILSTIYADSGNHAGYGLLSGTSMAAPQASGALALVRQHFRSFTTRQVVERLRATCDPLPFDPHFGFDGRGSINIFRAVSDAKAYSLRIENPSAITLPAGIALPVHLSLKNYLDSLPHPHVRVELLDSVDNNRIPIPAMAGHITLAPIIADLAPMGSLDSANLTLSIEADPSTPARSKAMVRLWMTDTSVGYDSDYYTFEVMFNPGVETLDANNLTVSFDDKGNIGYRDPTLDHIGNGFVWTTAPPSIDPLGKSVLLGGGILIGRDQQHIVDGFGTYNDNFISTYTLNPASAIFKLQTTPWGPGQTIVASSSDSLVRPDVAVEINVLEHAYALTAPEAANTVIADYQFAPRNGNTKSFDAGLYLDWDIGENGLNDSAHFNLTDSIFYVWRTEAHYPVVGMKLASHVSTGLSYYALRNDADDGGYHLIFENDLQNGSSVKLPDSLKWLLLSHSKAASKGDVAVVLGVRGLSYADSARLTYIIGVGQTEAEVKQSLLNTEAIMEGRAAVYVVAAPPDAPLGVWPDPAKTAIRIQVPKLEGFLEVRLWDAIGRCVIGATRVENGGNLDLSKLPAGIYTIEVRAADRQLFRTIVKE